MPLNVYLEEAAATIKFDRLREAYQILDHAPDEAISLRDWACGTLACAAGYIAQTPKFNAYGLSLHTHECPTEELTRTFRDYLHPVYKDEHGTVSNFTALAYTFGLPPSLAVELFEARDSNPESGGTDREVWLARVEVLFETYNQELTNERSRVQEG